MNNKFKKIDGLNEIKPMNPLLSELINNLYYLTKVTLC